MPVTKHSATSPAVHIQTMNVYCPLPGPGPPAVHIQKLSQPFVTKRDLSLEIQAKGIEQKVDATTDRLYHHVHIATVQLTMPNFRKHRRTNGGWHSEGFYTHPQGYKMCLGVYAHGRGNGRGTHVSYFLYLMPGEFNNHLKWPFQGRITVQLLNQLEDNGHHSDVT